MNVTQGKEILEKSLIDGQGSPLPILANLSAHISNELSRLNIPINWCGFYTNNKSNLALILTTFSIGKPACVRLNLDTKKAKIFGVCAAGIFEKKTVYVSDVHNRDGHIACDEASKSELVVPVFDKNERAIAVLDIDCPVLDGFGGENAKIVAGQIEELIDWVNDNAADIRWNEFRNTLL